MPDEVVKPKSKRGFASMDPERQKAIAASGGKAAHAQGKAHQFTAEEAVKAGSKGGKNRWLGYWKTEAERLDAAKAGEQ